MHDNKVVISYFAGKNEHPILSIVNSKGKAIYRNSNVAFVNNEYRFSLTFTKQARGSYILRISGHGTVSKVFSVVLTDTYY
jgi:hypothetical protein